MSQEQKINFKKVLSISIFLIILLGIAIQVNSVNGSFLQEDNILVKDNIYIESFVYIPRIFTHNIIADAEGEGCLFRPIQMLTYMLYYSPWKLDNIGRSKEAIYSYKKALKISSDPPCIYNDLGMAYYELGKYQKTLELDIRRHWRLICTIQEGYRP